MRCRKAQALVGIALAFGALAGGPFEGKAEAEPPAPILHLQTPAPEEEPMPEVREGGAIPLLLGGLVGSAAGALAGGLAALPLFAMGQSVLNDCLRVGKGEAPSSPGESPKTEDAFLLSLCDEMADLYLYMGLLPVTTAEALGALVGILSVGRAQGRQGGWLGGSLGVVFGAASANVLTSAFLLARIRALQQDLKANPPGPRPDAEAGPGSQREKARFFRGQVILFHGLLVAGLTTLLGTVGYYLTSGR